MKDHSAGVTSSRLLAATAGMVCILALLTSCDPPGLPDDRTMPEPADSQPMDSGDCIWSDHFANPVYTGTNGAQGPPFPFIRNGFCRADDGTAAYAFEMSDARKTAHVVFGIEFSDFERADERATATYERSTIEVKTEFAVRNALSKWLTCRDAIRTKEKFAIDGCLEVASASVVRIGPGELEGVGAEDFPCGINVGPDSVRTYPDDTVPSSIYPAEIREPLVTELKQGDTADLFTDDRIDGIYVPEIFFQSQTFSTTLSECRDAP